MRPMPAAAPKASERSPSRRRFIREGSRPAEALIWANNRTRPHALRKWRCAVSAAISDRPRCLRVAWTLEWLFGVNGYAYPTDSFLARELGIQIKHVQAALQHLEKVGAIIRASVFVNGRPERRIWPSSAIIPPTVGNTDTPHDGADLPPVTGRQNTQEGKNTRRMFISSTANAARRDAELREAKALGETNPTKTKIEE